MNLNPFLKKITKAAFTLLCAAALYYFCEKQTQGFRFPSILSNLPNDPRWEIEPLNDSEQQKLNHLLQQPFTLLGSGGWCYAFLGADQQTVLKFYKHTHLNLPLILKDKLRSLVNKEAPRLNHNFHDFNFTSCILLYKEAKEQSGLIYVHLNKTEDVLPSVTLIDGSYVSHTLDLNKTEFVVQKKGELLLPYFQKLLSQGELECAKEALDKLLHCLYSFSQKGIKDYDEGLRHNFGFIHNEAVTLDISSFGISSQLEDPGYSKKELVVKTRALSRWLEKNSPELNDYFNEKLCAILKS